MALSFVASAPLLLGAAIVLMMIPLLYYLYIRFSRSKHNTLQPTEWPILGVLPFVISMLNSHSFHDSVTSILAVAKLLNFRLHVPWRTGFCYFLTCDPENVRHIFTRSFANYPKGDDFATVLFPYLAGTIFTADGEPWRLQRRRIHHVLTSAPILAAVSRTCRGKVVHGLVPAMARMAATGTAFDMQDMLDRLVFDMTVMVVFGDDPCCLSSSSGGPRNGKPPPVPVAAALDVLMEVAVFRHSVPAICWKTMRRFRVGPERSHAAAEAVLWDFVAGKIQTRMMAAGGGKAVDDHDDDDILSHYIDDDTGRFVDDASGEPTEFMHRTFINYLVALRDPVATALPWFVYSLATHPRVVSAVRDELAPIAAAAGEDGGGMVVFEPEELERLVYLRAALFESLRLYPPGPIERKVAAGDDVLPSGHEVRAGDTVLVLVYAMARMESVWGEDCREYRPERWLVISDESEDGAGSRLRFVPSYKFLAFNTGPRSCIGKSMAVEQMMSIAAAVVWNFDVEVVEGHAVEPKLSALLQMRNGLMVRVNNRGQRTSSSSVVRSS